MTLIMVILYLFVVVFPIWKILTRMGFSGWLSLLSLVPVLNLVLLWILALIEWPVEKQNIDETFR
ncbi:MAG: hypothetical protein JKY46_04250 [Robiginitomaculum sp.]|nr:hypothetical protein [Robiginitomaculum sp.]